MRKALWILSTVLLAGGVIYLWLVFDGYQKGRDEYDRLSLEYVRLIPDDDGKPPAGNETETEACRIPLPDDAPDRKIVDLAGLKEINPDVVAWLDLPAVGVSYPVVQGQDNEFYLHRDIYQEYLFAGSIFLDSYNAPSFANMNSILYGHNMRDESMFGRLDELQDKETVETMPYFWIYTPDADYLYKIFSVHSASNGSTAFTVRFQNAEAYDAWLLGMKKASCIDLSADLADIDHVVTLSTCTGSASEKCVVHGYRLAAVS